MCSSAEALPWTARKGSLALAVRLTPKSSRDEITGIEHLADGRAVLKVRVRALPEAGAANDALIRLLVKALAIPVSTVGIESGATSRLKIIRLAGDVEILEARLTAISAQKPTN